MFKIRKKPLTDYTKNSVKPNPGSILYCKLDDNIKRTGIFISGGRGIVKLDNDGNVKKVTPQEFLTVPNEMKNLFSSMVLNL